MIKNRHFLIGLFLLSTSLFWTKPAQAVDYTVLNNTEINGAICNPDNSCDSLRAAVDAANLNPGPDTIFLEATNYQVHKQLFISDHLTVEGVDPNLGISTISVVGPTPAWDTPGDPVIFQMDDTGVDLTLRNLRLTNEFPDAIFYLGVCLYMDTNSNVSIENSQFYRCIGSNGGAIFNGEIAVLNISDSEFLENQADVDGGAILWLGNSNSQLTITNTRFSFNTTGGRGGAMAIGSEAGEVITIRRSVFNNNSAGRNGGAYFEFGDGNPIISNSTFSSNQAGFNAEAVNRGGGGIFVQGSANLETRHSAFVFNDDLTGANGDNIFVDPSASLTTGNSYFGEAINPDNSVVNLGGLSVTGPNVSDEAGLLPVLDDQVVVADLDINPLNDDGVHLPNPTSPLVDTASITSILVDQRNLPRPQDGNGDGQSGSDIGPAEIGCGNGYLEAELGETCDDGDTITETCAPGVSDCLVCNSSCQEVAGAVLVCGDGLVTAALGEECDDGNNVDNDGCSSQCVFDEPVPIDPGPTVISGGGGTESGGCSLQISALAQNSTWWLWLSGLGFLGLFRKFFLKN